MTSEKNGAFTGGISPEMLADLGVKFVLTGHSERRHVFKEPAELVAKKAAAVLTGGFTLVHCVGEKLEERDANQTLQVVQAQLNEVDQKLAGDAEPDRLVIAYEPVWAIGTGRNATDQQAQEVHAFIRSAGQALEQGFRRPRSNPVRRQHEARERQGAAAQSDVDGGLIGGAALKADSFLAIVNAAE